jgi:hypothetical protein
MDADGISGAEFDRQSGQFRWRPTQPGDYQVTFHVSDDGFPPKSSSQRVRINVTDPPPAAPEAPIPVVAKPSFALAKFAYVTAITEVNGRKQTWISLRAEGTTLKLFEGDEFNVGQVPVVVRQIENGSVEMETDVLERRFRVKLGESLADGDEIADAGT